MPPGLMAMLFANPFIYSWIVERITEKVKVLSMRVKTAESIFNNFRRRGRRAKKNAF